MDWQDHLHLAARAAQAAGAHLGGAIAREKTVLSNAGKDTKLQADRDAEALIFQFLQDTPYGIVAEESGARGDIAEALIFQFLQDTPYGIVAEESGARGDIAEDALWWAVDPLDGTVNFSRGIPICCVSIGMMRGGAPWLGVIYDFNREELFSGAVGEGAWLNGEPIRVSPLEGREQAIFCSAFPPEVDDATMARYLRIGRSFKKVRMIGSAALALAYIACGRADAFVEENIRIWDAAAGAAIIQAAGGYAHIEAGGEADWACDVTCACHSNLCRF